MLLNFVIDDNGIKCTNASDILNTDFVSYLKCHFDFKTDAWNAVNTTVATFKSATYNVTTEILLDSNNNCYVDPEVYRRGGIVQCKLTGDRYKSDGTAISSSHITDIIEFKVNENITLPTPIPSKYDVFVAELELAEQSVNDLIDDIQRRLENSEFNGADGTSIESVVYNADGTCTVVLEDGRSFTSADSMKGEKGDRGDDGAGIANVIFGEDGRLTITLTTGTTFTTDYSIKGEQGDQGIPGAQGEPFIYEDFTPQQLDDLAAAATPAFSIGTVSTLNPDAQATASITGNVRTPSLNLGIPKGAKGDKGDKGDTYTLTSADKVEIRDAVYALMNPAEGGSF